MAAWLNKWLFFSVSLFFFYTGGKIPQSKIESSKSKIENGQPSGWSISDPKGSDARIPHPFHVSVVEINHNASDRIFEISCKIFTDDFEKVLTRNYHTRVDLINPPDKKIVDTLVKKYITSHLSITADGKPVSFTYLGFEHETDAVYSYVQVDNIAAVKKIAVVNKIMHDLFDDQTNLMHVTVGKTRKSTKLDYPSTDAIFSF